MWGYPNVKIPCVGAPYVKIPYVLGPWQKVSLEKKKDQ